MVDNYTDPRTWTRFPPEDALERLARYETYRNLLMGNHREVYSRPNNKLLSRPEIAKIKDAATIAAEFCKEVYVSSNYCKIATMLFANILFGKSPAFRVESEDDAAQRRVDQIVTDNMLEITNHQQEIEASHLGDAVYRVRWGRMNNWRKEGAVIEAIPASAYFPILSPSNVKDNLGAMLMFPFEHGDAKYLYMETHKPGSIRYELRHMDGDSIGDAVPLATDDLYSDIDALADDSADYKRDGNAVIWETDYPGLFVEHVANWTRPDQYFGISDYAPDIIANQGAINDLQSEIFRACMKHLDPKLALPEGIMKYDATTDKWYIQKSDLETIEVPAEVAASLPRYVTWDAKLDSARGTIDNMFQAIMMQFGISPSIFGFDNYGTADSAAALKLRMTQTLWNIGQKRMYFDAALKNVLYAAQYLDGRYGGEKYDPLEVSITWPDTLPRDMTEEVKALAAMRVSGLIAHETAVSRAQSIDGDALAGEMEKIRLDRQFDDLMQLAAAGAVNPDTLLKAYRREDVSSALQSAPAQREMIPEEE